MMIASALTPVDLPTQVIDHPSRLFVPLSFFRAPHVMHRM